MLGRNRETIITIKGVEVIVVFFFFIKIMKRENKNNITTEGQDKA